MEMMTLLCWIYREYVGNIFSVEMSTMGTVGVLKDIIKDRKHLRFRDVEADNLLIYSIFIPGDDEENLQEGLKQLSLEDKSHLDSRTAVSKLSQSLMKGKVCGSLSFTDPIPVRPHQICCLSDHQLCFPGSSATEPSVAVTPDMTLNCWVRGAMTSFAVEISSTKTVATLRCLFEEKTLQVQVH
ncbi:hypothetical protein J3R82DRAFT_9279 [Butyriboletus roseoflavus]|nr:hypothetical protein J3R82DRAFT_9279 [Butyriboletus roseoflavus]